MKKCPYGEKCEIKNCVYENTPVSEQKIDVDYIDYGVGEKPSTPQKEEDRCKHGVMIPDCYECYHSSTLEEEVTRLPITDWEIAFIKEFGTFESNYHLGNVEKIKSFIRHQKELSTKEERERISKRVGFLRQWLNEDRITEIDKLVGNEDIISWLNL